MIEPGRQESPLNRHFVEFVQRLAGSQSCPELGAAAGQLARARADGHICIDLHDFGADCLAELQQKLLATPVVGEPGQTAPLIIDGPYLYLQRYHGDETLVADFITSRQGMDLQGISLAQLQAAMADPAFYKQDPEEIKAQQQRLNEVEDKIDTCYQRWEALEDLTQ